MKLNNYKYIAIALLSLGLMSSCKKEEPTLFDESSNGAYFDYDSASNLTTSINFADYMLEDPDEVEVPVKLKLLGFLPEDTKSVTLKQQAVEGYEEAKLTLPEAVFTHDGNGELTVQVKVARPERTDVEYAAAITIDTGTPNSGMEGFETYTIKVSESYQQPSGWEYQAEQYYGEWTAEKHKFIARTLNNAQYYNSYNMWSEAPQVVSAVRQYHKEHPEEAILEFPFASGCDYNQPDYWGTLQEKYLGSYSSNAFVSAANALDVTTANEEEVFGGSEEHLKEANKAMATVMMDSYNNYWDWYMSGSNYRWQLWIPMFADMDYTVVQPVEWNAGMDKIEKYYGTYSADKYKFMIKTAIEAMGVDDFCLKYLFPVYQSWGDSGLEIVWDNAISYNGKSGEGAIYQFYLLFKEKGAAAGFTFPDGVTEPADSSSDGKKDDGK